MHRRRAAAFPARPAFQRGFELPDRRIARTRDRRAGRLRGDDQRSRKIQRRDPDQACSRGCRPYTGAPDRPGRRERAAGSMFDRRETMAGPLGELSVETIVQSRFLNPSNGSLPGVQLVRVGVVKSLALRAWGPVALVHTQKIEAQSEKPTWTKALEFTQFACPCGTDPRLLSLEQRTSHFKLVTPLMTPQETSASIWREWVSPYRLIA